VLPAPTIAVGGAVTSVTTALGSLSPSSLRWGSHRSDPSLNSGFAAYPPEQPGLGLAEHDELRIVLSHTQQIEDRLFRLDQ
jgi:hypothetical protein